MILTLKKVARYVETREWPATLDRWLPAPGERPATYALIETRRQERLLYLTSACAAVTVAAAVLVVLLITSRIVDASNGAFSISVTLLAFFSFAGILFTLMVRRRPFTPEQCARVKLANEYISTIAICMSALGHDVHAAVLGNNESLKRDVDAFLLAKGIAIAASDVAASVADGISAKDRAREGRATLLQQLERFIEHFCNLTLIGSEAKADDYIARGRQALATSPVAGVPAHAPEHDGAIAGGG